MRSRKFESWFKPMAARVSVTVPMYTSLVLYTLLALDSGRTRFLPKDVFNGQQRSSKGLEEECDDDKQRAQCDEPVFVPCSDGPHDESAEKLVRCLWSGSRGMVQLTGYECNRVAGCAVVVSCLARDQHRAKIPTN